jgi:hypothetical protein
LGRYRGEEQGSVVGRDMRAQALAKQSATLRTIKEREQEPLRQPLAPRRNSVEYNGRPSIMLGADVSRAMRWAEGGFEMDRSRNLEKSKIPEKPKVVEKPRAPEPKVVEQKPPQVLPPKPQQTQLPPPPVPPSKTPAVTKLPEENKMQEIPREPTLAPKVQVARSKTPEPMYPSTIPGPVLLDPYNKPSEKQRSPPSSKLKKLFGGKSKEEKEAKRVSRAMSPIPTISSPTPIITQPKFLNPPPVATSEIRAPSPVKEWEDDFDGTHRHDPVPPKPESYNSKSNSEIHLPIKPTTTTVEEVYRPATPPSIPIVRSETPTSQKSEDEELDRWAQIRKAAGQRALNRHVAPPKNNSSSENVSEVNIPRMRQNTNSTTASGGSPILRKAVKSDEEDEESVDARVARIRKRVQELTAGMSDD